MSGSLSQNENEPRIKCPQCGAPVTRTNASDSDASGRERIEFTCSNHHRTTVVLVETDDDDLSTPPNSER